ncbi:MAG: hypothetical protein AB7Q17_03250 [Phycisphaerae bacterium]
MRARNLFTELLLGAVALGALVAPGAAQNTAVSYQGQLTNGGQAASGLHDFRFLLFDAAGGGMQVGTTQCSDNVVVQGGLFTTTIDFGAQFSTSAPRYLEIQVRADTGLDCGNASGFSPLTPRQRITAAPVATYAATASALSASDGSPADAVIVDADGNVGIGTTTPNAKLDVHGNIRVGSAGQYNVAASTENLRIVRGTVASSGLALAGTGWGMTHIQVGIYNVSFNQAFTSLPTVTATAYGALSTSPFVVARIGDVTNASVVIYLYDINNNQLRDESFHFIAVGTR